MIKIVHNNIWKVASLKMTLLTFHNRSGSRGSKSNNVYMTPDWRDFTGDPAEDIATIIARYCYLECLVHPVLHLE